ncbi:MAG: hypothetical protein SFW35_09730 [Chitinophagales bacterium]|nr:hypothetical protein [Chitinophagales bacterium]
MVVEIKIGSSEEEIKKALLKLKKKRKPFDASKHFGKVDWKIDGLELQKQLRNEWR